MQKSRDVVQSYCNISFSVSQVQRLSSPDPFVTHPLQHLESLVLEISPVLLISNSFNLRYDFSLLLPLLLLSTTHFSLIFFLLQISFILPKQLLFDMPPGPSIHTGSVGAWPCPQSGKSSKSDRLGHNHRIRSPSLMRCIWGDGWEGPSTDRAKNKINS